MVRDHYLSALRATMGCRISAIALGALVGAAPCSYGADSSGVMVTPHALFAFDAGQILKSTIKQETDTSNVWQEHILAQLSLDATIMQRARIVLAAEAQLRFSFPMYYSAQRTFDPYPDIYIHQAEVSYKFGPVDRPWLELGAGVFPYKYNPDVRNLGEYLFRTGTYPPYILTTFDFPMARLLGFRASSNLDLGRVVSSLRQDLLLTVTTGSYPYQPSLSYITSAGFLNGMVEIGGGVSAANAIPVFGDKYVSPNVPNNVYLTNVVEDTVADTLVHADTNYYTFRGTKLMARMSIDPKRIWAPDGEFGIFGPNDLRLYCETAILGVRNYPYNRDSSIGYTDIRQRWPITVGFNLPAFKILNVLAFEVEYFGSRIPNDFEYGLDPRLPLYMRPMNGREYRQDDIKWSVYASRDIGRFVALHGMVANDHLRGFALDKRAIGTEEMLRSSDDWYYMLRLVCAF